MRGALATEVRDALDVASARLESRPCPHVPRPDAVLCADRGRTMARVSPKTKVEVARDHLTKAQADAADGDLRDALQWSFASLEAAIDALARIHGIDIDQQHWKRRNAAESLHEQGVLPKDLSGLHGRLNDERKAVFYDGAEPSAEDLDIDSILADVEQAVVAAESGDA